MTKNEQLIRESERIRILTAVQKLQDTKWQWFGYNEVISEVKKIIHNEV